MFIAGYNNARQAGRWETTERAAKRALEVVVERPAEQRMAQTSAHLDVVELLWRGVLFLQPVGLISEA